MRKLEFYTLVSQPVHKAGPVLVVYFSLRFGWHFLLLRGVGGGFGWEMLILFLMFEFAVRGKLGRHRQELTLLPLTLLLRTRGVLGVGSLLLVFGPNRRQLVGLLVETD